MGQKLGKSTRGAYDAIVYIDGSEVVAEDCQGRKIASGVAGTDDVTVLQAALTAGGKVVVNGAFTRLVGTEYIVIGANSSLVGCGIDITSLENIRVRLPNANSSLSDLRIKGTAGVTGAAIAISNNYVTCEDIYIESWPGTSGIQLYAANKTYTDIAIRNVTIYRPSGFGVYVGGEGTPRAFSRVILENVDVFDAGVYSNSNEWATGIDITEHPAMSDVYLYNCRVFGAYESCFHMESAPSKNGIYFYNCYAANAGQKVGGTYGAGFLISNSTDADMPIILSGCSSYNCLRGLKIVNDKTGIIKVSNFYDLGSFLAIYISGSTGKVYLSDVTTTKAGQCGLDMLSAQHIYIKNLWSIDPVGDVNDICNWLGFSTAPVTDCEIDIHVRGGSRHSVYGQSMTNCKISGSVISPGCTGIDYGLYMSSPTNCIVDGFLVDITGDYGIYGCGTITNTVIRNTILRNNQGGVLSTGIKTQGTDTIGKLIIDRGTMSVLGGVTTYYTNCAFYENSGSSTGTGSEQTIAHGLAAIPVGCKAWIKYLVGARYITEMIPFDATNIYPTVASGVAYEWRIE